MFPKKEDSVFVDPEVFDWCRGSRERRPSKKLVLADRLEQSRILNYSLALAGLAYLGYTSAHPRV